MPEQQHRRQRPENHWYEHKYKCNQYINEYVNVHIHRRHTGGNRRRQPLTKANNIYNTRLPQKKDELEHNMKHHLGVVG